MLEIKDKEKSALAAFALARGDPCLVTGGVGRYVRLSGILTHNSKDGSPTRALNLSVIAKRVTRCIYKQNVNKKFIFQRECDKKGRWKEVQTT